MCELLPNFPCGFDLGFVVGCNNRLERLAECEDALRFGLDILALDIDDIWQCGDGIGQSLGVCMKVVPRHRRIGMSDDGLDDGKRHSRVCGEGHVGVAKGVEADENLCPLVLAFVHAVGDLVSIGRCRDATLGEDAFDVAGDQAVILQVPSGGLRQDESRPLLGWRFGQHGGQCRVDGNRDGSCACVVLDLVWCELDDPAHKINRSPIEKGAVVEAEPGVDADGEEEPHFTLDG